MARSKPNAEVELVSIDSKGLTIDKLLTARIAPKSVWLSSGVSIGDAGIHPAEPLLEKFKKLDIPDFFDGVELQPVEGDGIENLYVVGGDGDGHQYVFGAKSERFFALWHDPTEFEAVAANPRDFIQWIIRERSDHLEGCPWEVFTTGAQSMSFESVWHREHVDPQPIFEKAKASFGWSREFKSPAGFELLNEDQQIDLRFKVEHRGQKSHIDAVLAKKSPEFQAFWKWLTDRGFGKVWG